MKKLAKNLICLAIVLLFSFTLVHFSLAAEADLGLEYGEEIGLSDTDPRIVVANVIRVALGFLGIIAVALIMYAGWLYMSAEGEAEKIEKAKKILKGAAIGLLIILSSFAIASFIISRMLGATGGGDLGGGSGGGGIVGPGGNIGFYIRSTSPQDDSEDVIRNVKIRTFFNKQIAETVDEQVLSNNFQVKKIAEIDSETGSETEVTEEVITGILSITEDRKEIDFLANAECGDENNTPNCLDEWSKFEVLVDSASGIITSSGQSLTCTGDMCKFSFSTGDSIDTGPPTAGIIPTQICQDDGSLEIDSNIIGAWGRDDVGISGIGFYEQRQGETENWVYGEPGTDSKYQSAEYKYDTALMNVGDVYTFRIEAEDMAGDTASASYTTDIKPGHCCNGIQDADEEGTDCGGEDCLSCEGNSCSNDGTCDDNLCYTFFCDDSSCLCAARPVINWISPQGGFCNDDINQTCLVDADCDTTCNSSSANGEAGSLITIGGKNFGDTVGEVWFESEAGETEAQLASSVNGNCENSWSDNQIIVVVPADAKEGYIKVKTANSYEDLSNDDYGPLLDDFVVNNISRPGLCKISPNNGIANDTVNYYGVNLIGVEAYFGTINNSIEAESLGFASLNGSAKVPGIESGKTSTFVWDSEVASNYLNFYKNEEPASGPRINYFEPSSGASGQYVTIYGQDFGVARELGAHVYFGSLNNNEASYDFPEVCADSVWSDNQVIVKVPDIVDGDYIIVMEIPNLDDVNNPWVISSEGNTVSEFTVDSAADLKPSLCKIEPQVGPRDSEVTLWGEYFGAQDANSKVRFSLDKDQASFSFWDLDSEAGGDQVYKIETTVYNQAVSGPVAVVKGSPESIGNSLNFEVGSCLEANNPNSACGSDSVCCASDSPNAGMCKTSEDECYNEVKACVYEFDFSTGNGEGGEEGDSCDSDLTNEECNPDGTMCNDDLVCNESCVCESETNPYSSCSGYKLDQCGSYFCPNSPGQCSTYNGGNEVEIGDCQYDCEGVGACTADTCHYDIDLDQCVYNLFTCAFEETIKDINDEDVTATCEYYEVDDEYHYYFESNLSCPNGWDRTDDGCINLVETCLVCNDDSECLEDGICAVTEDMCPSDATCNENNKCITIDESSCDCCCEIGQDARDCCAPLTCGGTCGSDTEDDNDGYGLCTGCADASDPDAACNCEGSYGKYCDASYNPAGVCVDCASITDPEECSSHSTCCLDAMNDNICRGTDDIGKVEKDGLGYCGYYTCDKDDEDNNDGCDFNPVASSTEKVFTDTTTCSSQCNGNDGSVETSCKKEDGPPVVCDTSICSSAYECISNESCGNCCCDLDKSNTAADTCRNLSSNLYCAPNTDIESACYDEDTTTAPNFGICCGCSEDDQCGTGEGCSNDTCCRARPNVISETPVSASDDEEHCRNVQIQATFDTSMNISSFSDNVVVLADYVDEQCPSDMPYYSFNNIDYSKKNIFAKAVAKTKRLISHILEPVVGEQVFANTNNYCIVSGTVSGEQVANSDSTILKFSPKELLPADKWIHVIVKGDEDLNSSTGVISTDGIGMDGELTSDEDFNGVSFPNSHTWSFKTLPDQGINNGSGVCLIDTVEITPYSYLFNTVINDLEENDAIPDSATFDTVADQDKVFVAKALSSEGQVLAPVESYYWDWTWNIAEDNVASIVSGVFADTEDRQLIQAQTGVTDARTTVTATANTNDIYLSSIDLSSQSISGEADIYVFLCQNPWPPVGSDGTWLPWEDNNVNCNPALEGCFNTNYELYYCRDAGNDGTVDDLPAILSDQARIRGKSVYNNLDVLKEVYYFRESTPNVADVSLTVRSVSSEGGEVELEWFQIADDEGEVDYYQVHYGLASRDYENHINVGDINRYTVDNLTNGEEYYFAISAVYTSSAVSTYSNEVSATPYDSEGPVDPSIDSINKDIDTFETTINWSDNSSDATWYKICADSVTVSTECSASTNFGDCSDKTLLIESEDGYSYTFANAENNLNCFGIVVYDKYSNESSMITGFQE